MVKKLLSFGAVLSVLLLPLISGAQGDFSNVEDLATDVKGVVDILIVVAFSAAVLFFFWGLATFILASGDESKKTEGKNRMIWGVIALFVMASIWGLVAWLGGIFGVESDSTIDVPSINSTL